MAKFNNALNIDNVSSAVYETSKINTNIANIKAKELTLLVQKLLSVGLYTSIAEAVKANVPGGTFVLIDDPKTPDKDFRVEMVPLTRGVNDSTGARALVRREVKEVIKEG